MTNSHTINTTSTSPTTQRQHADSEPITLHYVPTADMRDGRRCIALCGKPLTYNAGFTGRATQSASSLICPMCEMEADRRQHRYHDPNEPLFPLSVSLGLSTMMEQQARLTSWEAAERMGEDPKAFSHDLNEGTLSISQIEA
ncbi:MAG: hypothetical protein M3Z40_07080, partial [Bifidobacterium sp.]|nr:hypothetical protein [Bifidobacterium sp.]